MAGEFERFIANMIGEPDFGGINTVSNRVQPRQSAPIQAAASPLSPSPYAGRQAAPNAAMPPELLRMVMAAASGSPALQQATPVASQQPDPQPVATPTAPVQGPTRQDQSYVGVKYKEKVILVPSDQVQYAPKDAEVLSVPGKPGGIISDPADIQRARESGVLLEQQPDDVINAFAPQSDSPTSKQESYYPVEYTSASGTTIMLVPESYIDYLPQDARLYGDGQAITNPAQIQSARENGALLEQQDTQVQNAFRNTAPFSDRAEDRQTYIDTGDGTAFTPPETGVETYTVDQVREFNPDLATAMEASGRTEIRSDSEVFQDEQGGIVILDKEEADAARADAEKESLANSTENPEPVGTKLPAITTKDMRDRGMESQANELEANGINSIPDGYMAVRQQDGTVELVPMPVDGDMPSSPNIIAFGGRSQERVDRGVLGSGITDPAFRALAALDKPRQKVTEGSGNIAYRRIKGDGPMVAPGVTDLARWGLGLLPDSIAENTGLPVADFDVWADNNPDAVVDAYENGYTDPDTGQTWTGGQAVWELYSSTQPLAQRAINDVAMAPDTYLTMGGGVLIKQGGKVLRPLGAVGEVSRGRSLLGKSLIGTGRALQAPDLLMDKAISPVLGLAGSAAKRAPGIDYLLKPEMGTAVRTKIDEARQIFGDLQQKAARGVPEPDPAQLPIGSNGPRLNDSADGVATLQSPAALNDADMIAGENGLFPNPRAREQPPVETATRATQNGPIDPIDARSRVRSGEWTPANQRRATSKAGKPDDVLYDEPSGKTYTREEVTPTPENPFAGMKIGEQPDWEFLTPRQREDMGINEQNRIIDEIFQKHGNTTEYRSFGEMYEQPARDFIEQERAAFDASKAGKAERKGNRDYANDRRLALAEAEHIVNDLLPIYREAFGETAEVPMHRTNPVLEFRNRKTGKANPLEKQGDGYYISQAIFSEDEKIQRYSVSRLKRMAAAGNPEITPELMTDLRNLRGRYMSYRSNAPVGDYRSMVAEQKMAQGEARTAARRDAGFTGADEASESMQRVQPDLLDDAPLIDVPSPGERVVPVSPEPSAYRGADGLERANLPVSALRSTANMSESELAAAGLPRLQPRADAFSATSVDSINKVGWDWNRYDDIIATRGNDGEYYLIAGHSRVEAAKKAGITDLPAKIVDNSDPNYLRQLAEETNTNRAGYTQMERARMADAAVQRGESFEDIGVRQGLGNNARGTAGTADARRYADIAKIDREKYPRLYELVDQGYIDTPTAAAIGKAIDLDYLGNGEVERIRQRITNGTITPDGVVRLIDAQIAVRQRQSTSAMSLFGDAAPKSQAEQMVDDIRKGLDGLGPNDNRLDFMEDKMRDVAETRIDAIAALRRDYPEAYNRGKRGDAQFSPDRIADEAKRKQFDRDLTAVRDLSDILGIDPDQALTSSARSPFTAATIPGGPQVSKWLDESVPSGIDPNPSSEFVSRDTRAFDYFRDRSLNENESRFFNKKFADGTSYRDRFSSYADEFETTGVDQIPDGGKKAEKVPLPRGEAEQMAGVRMLDDIAEDILRTSDRRWDYYQRELARITAKDPKLDPLLARQRALVEASSKSPVAMLRVYDATLAVLRESTLYNALSGPRYILTQAVGNTITPLINKRPGPARDFLRARNIRRAYLTLNDNQDDFITRQISKLIDDDMSYDELLEAYKAAGDMPSSVMHDPMDELLAELNIGGYRQDVSRPVRDQLGETVEGKTNMARAADRLRLGKLKLPNTGIFASKHIRDMAGAFDVSSRRTYYDHTMRANMANATPSFRQHMFDNLPAGVDRQTVTDLWETMPDYFGGDRVRDVFESIPNQGYVERMARDWENSINKMDKHARDEVNRLFFSGNLTNGDAILGRVVFFHYWASRAMPLYTMALMREPAFMMNYYRAYESMNRMYESGDMSPAVKSFLKVMGTYGGFNIFIRPDALMQTIFTATRGDDWAPDNESFLGTVLRNSPFMINPLIDGVSNILGLQGDGFAPDPFMLNNWAMMTTNVLNLGASRTGNDPVPNIYQEGMSWVRDKTSGVTSNFLPGSEHIDHMSSTTYARRDINYLIQDIAEEQGLDPSSPEVMAAMEDSTSPLYRQAFKRYANAQGLTQLARILPTSMLYPKVRVARNDDVRKGINSTEGDDQQYWYQQRENATTLDPAARQLMQQGDEYYAIGTDEQRASYSVYNSIQYGNLTEPIFVNGKRLDGVIISGMTGDERKALADQWADQEGASEDIDFIREERKAYRESHKEWADYISWSGQVRDQGPDAFWREAAKGNPNAARWYDESGKTVESPRDRERVLTSVDAYMAIHGVQQDMYQPSPISTNDGSAQPFNPIDTSGSSGSGSGAKRTYGETADGIREDIAEYENEMAEFSAATGGVDLDGINPMARTAYVANLQRDGVYVPSMSARMRRYYEWRDAQPQNSDTSPEAYQEWYETNNPK